MFTQEDLKELREHILELPRPTQMRILDNIETIIDHQGFITVGEVNMLVRGQLH